MKVTHGRPDGRQHERHGDRDELPEARHAGDRPRFLQLAVHGGERAGDDEEAVDVVVQRQADDDRHGAEGEPVGRLDAEEIDETPDAPPMRSFLKKVTQASAITQDGSM